MSLFPSIKNDVKLQYLLGIGTIVVISSICYLSVGLIGYHVVALILLLAVSVLAMFFEILPVVTVAVLSALIWNFFFIQPQLTFKINTPEDALFFLMYFVIAVMNAVFTTKVRKAEAAARERKEREKTIRLYNTMLNSLSHELKTPIATVIGAVDTLKENATRLSPSIVTELYDEIEVAGNRLNRQVGNLLNMSRLESDFISLQLDWYDLRELIHKNVQETQEESHHIFFEEEDENFPLVKIDAPLVSQILHNILHNAIQYTPPGSKIIITAKYLNGNCIIKIQDNGPGFPEDTVHKVFEKFYRLPNTATGGTGLGLSIARGFAQAHNGKITLENIEGGGALFTVIIPAECSIQSQFQNE